MPDRTPDDLDPKALKKLPRDELNEVAADAGVTDAEDLANKDEVIAAIPNPALAPEPPAPPAARDYIVNGTQPVFGHAPGERFTKTLTAEQEAMFIAGGHLIYAEEK